MLNPSNLVLDASSSGLRNKNCSKKHISEVFSPMEKSDNMNPLWLDPWEPFTDILSISAWMETDRLSN